MLVYQRVHLVCKLLQMYKVGPRSSYKRSFNSTCRVESHFVGKDSIDHTHADHGVFGVDWELSIC